MYTVEAAVDVGRMCCVTWALSGQCDCMATEPTTTTTTIIMITVSDPAASTADDDEAESANIDDMPF